ncbi:MAG: hypothetical protein WBK96_13920 [Candidatus Manganitrophaceae bacterium]
MRTNKRGAALITMVLMVLLVTGLLMMALNISGIERELASTNRRTTQGFHTAEGGVGITNQIILDTLEVSAIPKDPPTPGIAAIKNYPATIVFDCANSATVGDKTMIDFVEELRNGGGALANDSVIGTLPISPCINPPFPTTADPGVGILRGPDLVINGLNGQTIQVDVDLEEGGISLDGSELEEFGIRYHRKTGGTGCSSGTLYYIDSVATGPMNTRLNVGSAYLDCS